MFDKWTVFVTTLASICVTLAVADGMNETTPIERFQEYLRIPTISLESDLGPCVEFLKRQAYDVGLNFSVYYPANKQNPVVLMTWTGSQPELSSLLLNSHMDVVPVFEDSWKYPPFGAEMDGKGNIYARGAQDMKSVGMAYLEAIREWKRRGVERFKRTVHLTYVPDEETGGEFGMAAFIQTDVFKNLNVGCALDEGYPSATDNLEVYYTERAIWVINITTHGQSGHASLLFNDTAVEKLNYIMNKFLELRKTESEKLYGKNLPYGNVTSINLTILKGGSATNVVPPEMYLNVNMRVAVDANKTELLRIINGWGEQAGDGTIIDIHKTLEPKETRIDESNPFWTPFKEATELLNLTVIPAVFRAGTDGNKLRNLNIPTLGFSPFMNTPPLLHGNNECLSIDAFSQAIRIYETIIERMANFS